MILSKEQYERTNLQIEKFTNRISQLELIDQTDSNKDLLTIQLSGLRSQLEDLFSQTRAFDMLFSGPAPSYEISDVSELPGILIKARISSKMSQEMFAKAIGLPLRDFKKLEEDKYTRADLSLLKIIIEELKIDRKFDFPKISKEVKSKNFIRKMSNSGIKG